MRQFPVIISLDQNFLWNFHTGNHPNASRLFELIRDGVHQGQACCPIHTWETVTESSLLGEEKRTAILALANQLNAGLAFRDFPLAVAHETLRLLRPGFQPERFLRGEWALPQDFRETGASTKKKKESHSAELNRVRSQSTPFSTGQKWDVWTVYHERIMSPRLGSMVRLINAIRDRSSTDTGIEEWGHALGVAEWLLSAGIETDECNRLVRLVCDREWEQVPHLLWHSRLCTQLEFEELKSRGSVETNDYFDLTRLAVALTDSDAVFCDERMSKLIERTGFEAPPHFCWKTSDAAIAHLEHRFKVQPG